jgi:hypothetical protein
VVYFNKEGSKMGRDSVFKTREMLWKYTNLSSRNVGKGVNYKFYMEALKYNGEQLKLMGVDMKTLMSGDTAANNSFQSESNLSAFAGIIGFAERYSEMTKPMGFNEMTIEHCVKKIDVAPETIPNEGDLDCPAAMVSLVGGEIIISIGLKCPDTMVEQIKSCMGIDRLVSQAKKFNTTLNVKIVRNSTWDHAAH